MKGVSPLIATVLLVVIVVILATIITTFSTDLVTSSTETIQNRTGTSAECSGASVSISDVFLTNGTAGTARVSAINNGLKDDMIIVNGVLTNRTGTSFSASSMPVIDFDVGEVVTLTFSNLSVPSCGDFAYVTVTTNCGGVSDTYKKGAKCV